MHGCNLGKDMCKLHSQLAYVEEKGSEQPASIDTVQDGQNIDKAKKEGDGAQSEKCVGSYIVLYIRLLHLHIYLITCCLLRCDLLFMLLTSFTSFYLVYFLPRLFFSTPYRT